MTKGAQGPKFTETEREAVFEYVALLDRRGHRQYDIGRLVAEKFGKGITQPRVSQMLTELRERYRASYITNTQELIAEKVAQLREVRLEAWAEYNRLDHKITKRTKQYELREKKDANRPTGVGSKARIRQIEYEMRKVKEIVVKEGTRGKRLECLNIVMATLVEESRLLGLYPKEAAYNNSTGAFGWDVFMGQVAADPPDEIEGKIVSVMEQGAQPVPVKTKALPKHGGTNGEAAGG